MGSDRGLMGSPMNAFHLRIPLSERCPTQLVWVCSRVLSLPYREGARLEVCSPWGSDEPLPARDKHYCGLFRMKWLIFSRCLDSFTIAGDRQTGVPRSPKRHEGESYTPYYPLCMHTVSEEKSRVHYSRHSSAFGPVGNNLPSVMSLVRRGFQEYCMPSSDCEDAMS